MAVLDATVKSGRWKQALLQAAVFAPGPVVLAAAGRPVTALLCAALSGVASRMMVHRLTNSAQRWEAESTRTAELNRMTEEALHHSTDVLRSIISALPVGVVAINRQARVELWNHAAETMLGYSAEEMIGHPAPTKVFMSTAEDNDIAAADVFLRMVTGQLVKSEDVRCRRKDGSALEASFSGAPLMDDDERIQGAICVFEDISHRKTMARALQQAQKMEAVGQLTGGMAHDFNNILGVAIGNLDLLEEEVADLPNASDLVKSSLGALLRGAELTRALLAFARRQPLRPSAVNVAEMLESTMKVLGRVLGEPIQIRLETAGPLWPVVVDAAQLEASITNLAINARDAMPAGGTLSIVTRNALLDADGVPPTEVAPGEYVSIEVSDTGSGMTSEVLAHVFEPFFTTKPVGQGTGLGLSMVYGFIKQSGGHIKIYSEPGLGTTVRLYLPHARDMAAEQQARSDTEDGSIQGGSETILVVDDNKDVRRMVTRQLAELGYRVLEADEARKALTILEAEPAVDLLFTDIVMPHGMDGFTLAEAVRTVKPAVGVLFTSGFPSTSAQAAAGLGGSAELLSKPYRRQELAKAVRRTLEKTKVRT